MRIILAICLLVSTCSPAVDPPDAGADAATPIERRYYALSDVQVVFDDDGRAQGVDLDGLDSTGAAASCDAVPDDPSLVDPSEVGVDNSAAHHGGSLAVQQPGSTCGATGAEYGCSTRAWREDIVSGERIWVIEIAESGAAMEVALHLAHASGAPALADGRLAPGQTFALEELARTTDASIDGAVLHARFPGSTELEMVVSGDSVRVVRVHRLEIAALMDEGAPARGTIGGALAVDDIVAMVAPTSADTIRELLEVVADLDPDPADPTRCRQLSFGLGFATVAASARAE